MLELKPALQSSQGRSKAWSGALLTNAFAELADGDKRSAFSIIPTPGLTEWAEVASGPIRGAIVMGGTLYVVSGQALYSVDVNGGVTNLGTITGAGPVRMAANYTQVAVAAGGVGHVYSAGALTTPVPFSVSDVAYADGYIVWTVANSEQFFISALDDATTYDAADIASVEGFPDDIVGLIVDHRELQFYGARSTEIFYNSGAAAFPFERQGNSFIERGCFDRDSLVKIDNSVIFMGEDRIVYTLVGYQPQRISTHWVEWMLRDTTYARAWSYTLEGHKFYVLDCNRATLVFDVSTGAWHQRKSWGSDLWRCNGAVMAYGRLLLTDRESGKLFTPSPDVHTEDGQTIAVEILLPTIESRRERATMYAFEVLCETGVGNSVAADPQIMLQYSDDNGNRWSNEMWRSLGKVGEYRTRAVWRKLGQFRQRQMKLRITDAVRRQVISYHADVR